MGKTCGAGGVGSVVVVATVVVVLATVVVLAIAVEIEAVVVEVEVPAPFELPPPQATPAQVPRKSTTPPTMALLALIRKHTIQAEEHRGNPQRRRTPHNSRRLAPHPRLHSFGWDGR